MNPHKHVYYTLVMFLVGMLAIGLTACGEYPGVPLKGQQRIQLAQFAQPAASSPSESTSNASEGEGGAVGQLRSELEGVKAEDVELATGPVAIELKDFELVPNLIRVKAGEVPFILNNTSTHTHNYRIVAWDDRKNVIYRGRPKVGAKKKKEDTIPLEPGVYYIYCNVSDHEERGMVGKLFVDS